MNIAQNGRGHTLELTPTRSCCDWQLQWGPDRGSGSDTSRLPAILPDYLALGAAGLNQFIELEFFQASSVASLVPPPLAVASGGF